MNLEGLTLHILTNKLKEELLGGKIYKVFMPSYESLLLLVNANAILRHCLLISAAVHRCCTCRIIYPNVPKVLRLFVCCCASIWKKAV